MTKLIRKRIGKSTLTAGLFGAGLAVGALGGHGLAQVTPPTEHKGISVELLGTISPELIERAVGLKGYLLMVRALTVEPGGQIANHDHVGRPGLVAMTNGELVDVRESGEETYNAKGGKAIIEDEDTVHWLYNPGDEPATAILCDLRPPQT
jgi:quercetin dioxygenase-like cupin family protein